MTIEEVKSWVEESEYVATDRAKDSIWASYPSKRMGALTLTLTIHNDKLYIEGPQVQEIQNKEELTDKLHQLINEK